MEALQQLCDACPTQVMFPNLRILEYSIAHDESWQLAEFFGPRLVEFYIETAWIHSCPPPSFLLRLPNRCPELKTLSVKESFKSEDTFDYDQFNDMLLEVICRYEKLQCLDIPNQWLTPQVTRRIIKLPDLRELKWYCDDVEVWKPQAATRRTGYWFPKLHRWVHYSATLTPFATIMSRLAPQKELDALTLLINNLDVADFQRTIALITEHLSHAKLTKFVFNNHGRDDGSDVVTLVPFASFRPLFCLKNLTQLWIGSRFPPRLTIDLDDSSLQEIAVTWPQLHLLRIRGITSRVTMVGFWAILSGCSLLNELQIQFCFSTEGFGVDDTKWVLPAENHPLRVIDVADSQLYDPDGVAAKVLHRTIPNLTSFEGDHGADDEAWRRTLSELVKLYILSR
jgi:hypothetical protein